MYTLNESSKIAVTTVFEVLVKIRHIWVLYIV